MKTLLFIILLSFIYLTGNSQDITDRKNELSIILIDYSLTPEKQALFIESEFKPSKLSSIRYKRLISEKTALRFSIGFRKIIKEVGQPSNWNTEGTYSEGFLKIGYEYKWKLKHWIPYVALDAVCLKSETKGSAGGGVTGYYSGFESSRFAFGIGPTIGLKYEITDYFSLGLESSTSLLYAFEDNVTQQIFPESNDPPEVLSEKYFTNIINPVAAFAINIKF